jgi:hypothetical protein
VIEGLEEYRDRRQQTEDNMQSVTSEVAKDRLEEYLRRAFAHKFMRPDQTAWAPISFPGIRYQADGTLSAEMKARATEYFMGVLHDNGFVVKLGADEDPRTAVHHILWDQWTKEEVGNGRFTGRLFNDHGQIYPGCTAVDAARYMLERLTALGGVLRSFAVR